MRCVALPLLALAARAEAYAVGSETVDFSSGPGSTLSVSFTTVNNTIPIVVTINDRGNWGSGYYTWSSGGDSVSGIVGTTSITVSNLLNTNAF